MTHNFIPHEFPCVRVLARKNVPVGGFAAGFKGTWEVQLIGRDGVVKRLHNGDMHEHLFFGDASTSAYEWEKITGWEIIRAEEVERVTYEIVVLK